MTGRTRENPRADASGSEGAEPLEWRCVRSRPKAEHLAAAHVAALDGAETFCPRIRFRRATARGRIWFVEALFPGYFFARFDLGQSLRAVQSAPNVTGAVSFGGRIPSVPDEAVEALRAEVGEDDTIVLEDDGVEIGDSVEVAAGPLRGAAGMVTAVPRAGERVRILLEFLGAPREVEVPLAVLLGIDRTARMQRRAARTASGR